MLSGSNKEDGVRKSLDTERRLTDRRFRAVLETVMDGIVVIDESGLIEIFNPGAAKIFGYRPEEVLGQDVSVLMPEPYRSQHDAYMAEYLRTRVAKIVGIGREVVGLRKDGTKFPLDLAVTECDIQGKLCFVGILRDITERKEIEEELIRARKAAEDASRVKSEFLANMSHEIRTPMNAIIGYTECVLDELDGPLNDIQRESLGKVAKAAQNLLQMINNILDISKIEAGRSELYLEGFDMVQVARGCVELLSPLAEKKGLELGLSSRQPQFFVHADTTRMRQVLLNLLSNALKFTEKGRVEISLAQAGERLEIQVRDTGIGMSEKETERIFENFMQADSSTTKKYGGTGLGMPISKAFVEMHGGTLELRSEKGKGSIFTVFLPIRSTQVYPNRAAEKNKDENSGARRILVIDDSTSVTEVVEKYLEDSGFRVYTTNESLRAVPMAQQIKPDVILLDIMMPHKDGLQVLAELKQNPKTREIPVFILSMSDHREIARQLGAKVYLDKPVQRGPLLEALKMLESKKKALRIAIVDDNEADRHVLRRYLQRLDCRFDEYADGKEAWNGMQANVPDFIFLDLVMPGMSGFELLGRINAHPPLDRVPVVIMSGMDLSDEKLEQLNTAAFDILQKRGLSAKKVLEVFRKAEKTPS